MKKGFIILSTCLTLSTLFSCNVFDDEVTILYTNDVHGEIDNKLSYSTVSQMKKNLQSQHKNVLLLDSGDHISGGFYTTYDRGKSMVECMSLAGYDAATLGNHEFDYNFDYLDNILKTASYPYIATNLYHTKDGKPTERYTDIGSKVFKFNYVSVGVIGVATPESISMCSPETFKDYTFMQDQFYESIQKEIDSIKNQCNYIVCMSHLGDETQDNEFTATKLAKNTSGLNVILDGHTHQIDKKVIKNKDEQNVLITQTGSKFKRIGKLTLSKRGATTELISENEKIDSKVKAVETKVINAVDESLKEEIATTKVYFNSDGKRESNIGDLITEGLYYYYNLYNPPKDLRVDVTMMNSGGIRYHDIKEETWSLRTCQKIHSFNNLEGILKISGYWLKVALEFSSRKLDKDKPEYFGGFQEVCGVTYKVDTSITPEFEIDGSGNYISGPKVPRLSEIKILDSNGDYQYLDESKDYYIGASTFVLGGGDGLTMFKNGIMVKEENLLTDYDVLVNYIKHFKTDGNKLPVISSENSPLREKYPNLKINYTDEGFGERVVLQ